jgi:hypothetical protein
MDETLWKPIPGFAGYDAHPDGFIGSRRRGPRRVLRPAPQSKGYLTVGLSAGTRASRQSRTVHSLILETFRGPCPPGMEARHLDGDQANNRLENLAWGTRAEQAEDKRRHGTDASGMRNGRTRLATEDVVAIRASTERGTVLAARFGITEEYVCHLRRGRYRRAG